MVDLKQFEHKLIYSCLFAGVFAGLIYQFVFRAQGQRPTPKRQDSRDYEMCAKGDQ